MPKQDYHPRGHVSFASSHTSRKAFDSIKVQHPITGTDKDQELWPDHCVQGTTGADFEKSIGARLEDLVRNGTGKVVRKVSYREAATIVITHRPTARTSVTGRRSRVGRLFGFLEIT